MLAVSDTGTGMDEATKARIFEPFFTTEKEDRGTGLGLATAYGIVKQSGGNIWVYSEPNIGTIFKIYVPASEQIPEDSSLQVPAVTVLNGSETILLVEDDDGVRELIHTVLQGAGYRVLVAHNAEEAVATFDQVDQQVDLLLTDVVLPGINGAKLATLLLSRKPTLCVVYMSGYTDNAIVHHGVLDPGVAFMDKPIKPQLLLRRLREFLSANHDGPGATSGRAVEACSSQRLALMKSIFSPTERRWANAVLRNCCINRS